MAEVILTFAEPFTTAGVPYQVIAFGRETPTVWEGWLQFLGPDGEARVTARETTQPDRRALEYWATGLSLTYLEGAFDRSTPLPDDAASPYLPS